MRSPQVPLIPNSIICAELTRRDRRLHILETRATSALPVRVTGDTPTASDSMGDAKSSASDYAYQQNRATAAASDPLTSRPISRHREGRLAARIVLAARAEGLLDLDSCEWPSRFSSLTLRRDVFSGES